MDVIAEGLAFPEGPVVMADGSLATLSIYREEGISAWTGHSTEGVSSPSQ